MPACQRPCAWPGDLWVGGRSPPGPLPLEIGNLPLPSTPPLGIGKREWGIGEEDLPTPHPTAFFHRRLTPLHHSPFPRFPIPDCRFPCRPDSPFPIGDSQGEGGRARTGTIPSLTPARPPSSRTLDSRAVARTSDRSAASRARDSTAP